MTENYLVPSKDLGGKYISGQGKAHNCCKQHTPIFNCRMYGTFNVCLTDTSVNILQFTPSIQTEKNNYWFITISQNGLEYCGWAVRGVGSHQRFQTLEILTKELLPNELKERPFNVNVYERWDEQKINEWAKEQYWFQTFSFSSTKRADSEMLWNTIDVIDWSNKKVLDIGCHYGYFSFQASSKGACVYGRDKDSRSLQTAKIIRNNIIQQDVNFKKASEIPFSNSYDVSLYLSVHHQIDPTYLNLQNTINRLKNITREHIFVELILPPMFPQKSTMTEKQIDKIVGGTILARYKHKVRGERKIYWIQK